MRATRAHPPPPRFLGPFYRPSSLQHPGGFEEAERAPDMIDEADAATSNNEGEAKSTTGPSFPVMSSFPAVLYGSGREEDAPATSLLPSMGGKGKCCVSLRRLT